MLDEFQSLGRDSVCSYIPGVPQQRSQTTSFNPSVGILFVHTGRRPTSPHYGDKFQSLGRDSVCSYLRDVQPPRCICRKFQSLGRDSVCSYLPVVVHQSLDVDVSIPRSGFCLFILGGHRRGNVAGVVSIPRSGFCLFIRHHRERRGHNKGVSIPRSGFCLFIHYRIAFDP